MTTSRATRASSGTSLASTTLRPTTTGGCTSSPPCGCGSSANPSGNSGATRPLHRPGFEQAALPARLCSAHLPRLQPRPVCEAGPGPVRAASTPRHLAASDGLQRLGRERLRRHVPDRNDAPRLPQPQPSRLTAEWRMRRAGGGAMRRAAARCDVRRGSCGPRADAPPRVLVSTRRKCEPALLAILKRGGAPQGGCLADTIPLQREQQPDAHAGGRALCATDGPHQRQQGRASTSTHAEAHDLRGATPPARLHAPQH
mmetsp:Transcript_19241/g.57060  ORF Transcript_19241/g.57060 Transcript_19241/m.57060 type:complete len:257 (+) Transcript_19241:759-1529(+)